MNKAPFTNMNLFQKEKNYKKIGGFFGFLVAT
jgi:hypothetical protein